MTAADPTSDDYYSVLGVARDATEQDISKAYKKAAIRWHPDKNPGDPKAEEAFKRVAEAYDCLSKPDKRAAYDRFGKDALKGGMNGGGGSFDHAQAEEIFKTFFGGQDPFDVLLKGGGMPGGFGMHFASMNGGGMGGGRGGCGPNGGPRMMFSSMGGMPGGMGGMGGMGFGPEMMFGGMPGGMGGGGGCGGMGGRGMGGRSVRPKRSVGFNELAPNTLVSISGLRSAAHQNGKHARVLSYDPEKQRYTVRLLEGDDDSGGASGEQLAVRVDNLHAVVDVELTDVSSSPALNGTTGRLLSYDSDSGRYHVRLHDGRIAALAPTSVIVPSGTCCTVTGLASASAQQHNGARAKVVGYDRASGRYEVAVSPSSHLKLKRENVRV